MQIFFSQPNLMKFKYRIHNGPFLGEYKSVLRGDTLTNALIFEEDEKYSFNSNFRYGKFLSNNSLLKEFIINRIDVLHVKLKSKNDEMCLTYNPDIDLFYKNICNLNKFQIFTEIPDKSIISKFEKLSKQLYIKNKHLMILKSIKNNLYNLKLNDKSKYEIGKNKSNKIKYNIINNFLKNNELISNQYENLLGKKISNNSFINEFIDYKTKLNVLKRIKEIENIMKNQKTLNNLMIFPLRDSFKYKKSHLIPNTLENIDKITKKFDDELLKLNSLNYKYFQNN